MYDNVNLYIDATDVPDTDFLSETVCNFEVTGEHDYNGQRVITGGLKGLKIAVNNYSVKIRDGSLCKWYLGDNFQTLGRGDVQRAIEKMSDTLHLPIAKAKVTRLDIAQNIVVKNPVEVYFNHLGELQHKKRLVQPDGLYYTGGNSLLLFYNKEKEQRAKGNPIPELYQNRHTLRYEQRYTKRLPAHFGIDKVTAGLLYDERFYIDVLNKWRASYKAIKKVNDITLNFEAMRTKKDFDLLGRLSLIENAGGELALIGQISEAYKTGKLTRRQADELKRATRETCKAKTNVTATNEAIWELDKKINEAVRYYR